MACLLKFKKLLASFLLAAIFIPFTACPLLAFSSGSNETYPIQFMNAVFETDEMNLQSFVYETVRAVMLSVIVIMIGEPDEYKDKDGCFYEIVTCIYNCKKDSEGADCSHCENTSCNPKTSLLEPNQSNPATFQMLSFINFFYTNPPASGVQYLADLGQKLHLVEPVFAQNISVGWDRFDFAMDIWKAFRNTSYLFLVLVLLLMGFAIMFRVKISPQAVITLQSALPRIIVTLIIITFSYAIVGFLTDLMYVLMNLINFIFRGIIENTNQIWGSIKWVMLNLAPEEPTTNNFRLFMTMVLVGSGPLLILGLVIIIVAIIGLVTGGIGSAIALIVAVVLALVLIIALLRLCWALLRAYVNVLLALIFSPFILLVGVLPGSNSVGSWLKNLLGNLLVWPAVFIMVYIAGFIALSGVTTTGGGFANLIFLPIIGIGILLLTPRAADMIKAFIAGQPFNYGSAIGEALGPARFATQAGWSAAKGYIGGDISAGAGGGRIGQFVEKRIHSQDARDALARALGHKT